MVLTNTRALVWNVIGLAAALAASKRVGIWPGDGFIARNPFVDFRDWVSFDSVKKGDRVF